MNQIDPFDYEELRKIIHNIDDFERDVRNYCTPVLWPNFKDPILTEFGNGTFVQIDGHFGVLTASHVSDIFARVQTNHFYIAKSNFELEPIYFEEMVRLPDIKEWASCDLGFIKLKSVETILNLGYKFYNLTNTREKGLEVFPVGIHHQPACAFLATPSEGKRLIELPEAPGKTIIEYPKAAFSFGGVKEGSYSEFPFYFPETQFPDLKNLEFRIDEFVFTIASHPSLPKLYTGTSGGSLWRANLLQEGRVLKYVSSELLGIIIQQKNDELYIRGGVSVYKTFLTYCSSYLKDRDVLKALKTAAVSF